MFPLYTIHARKHWLLRDEPVLKAYSPSQESEADASAHKSMLFHVSAGDYITTLATILRFFEESVFEDEVLPDMRSLQLKTIRDVISDLLYLNKHYTIVPKDQQSSKYL